MDTLVIEGSNDSPRIHLDREKGILYIGGSSLPENVVEVYQPVLDWLEKYCADPNPVTKIDFFFEYLNTSSSHMIMRILEKFIESKNIFKELHINWFYPTDDNEMRSFGQELAEMSNYPIKIIERDLD